MSTPVRNSNGSTDVTATLPCTSCATPTVAGKHCAECGTVAILPVAEGIVPTQRETVIDLTTPGDETLTVVLSPGVAPGDERPDLHGDEIPADVPAGDDALLLDDLADQPDVEGATRSRPSRRTAILAGAVSVTLVLLLIAGRAVTRYLGGSTTRDALTSSARDFGTVVAALSAAQDAEQVSAAARTAPAAADRIDGQLRVLGRPDDAKARAVVDQLTAEKQLLSALGGLATLSKDPMKAWASAQAPVTDAVARERETRTVLALHDGDGAAQLPDTAAMMRAVTSAVGTSLAASVVTQASGLLTALGAATTTAGVREAAGRAASEQSAVASVLPALTDQSGRPVLSACSRALAALASLSTIDGENTTAWAAARAELTAAFGQLAGAGAEGGALSAQSASTLASVDGVITRAAAQMADWNAAHDAAVADRNSDNQAMSSYVDGVRAGIKGYELLRSDLQTFFDRVEDPNVSVYYFEAYNELYEAEQSRRDIRDGLAGMSVQDGMRTEHNALVAVLTRAIVAVQAGYDGMSQADDCYDYCYYRDTPGYQRFQSESDGITKAYAAAIKDWESTSTAVTNSIKNRELPAKPAV